MKMNVLYLETGRYKTAIRADGVVFMGHPPESASLVAFAEANGAIVFRCDGTAYINTDWLMAFFVKHPAALHGLAMTVKVARRMARKQPGFLQLNKGATA